jgi:hypothetical protein
MMADCILNLRELNRATLARQMLLKRETLPVLHAVEGLVGLQAQLPVAPYVGLWTRLNKFSHEDLARAIENRKIVCRAIRLNGLKPWGGQLRAELQHL